MMSAFDIGLILGIITILYVAYELIKFEPVK